MTNHDLNTQKLDEAISLLVNETPHGIECDGPNGGTVTKWVMADPLLVQLRRAKTPGMEGGSGGSGGRPSPLALNAFDLYREIDEQAGFLYWTHKDARPLRSYTLEDRIQYWVARARLDRESLAEAEKIVLGWNRSIEALFNPKKVIPLAGTCPECKTAFHFVEDDGERTRKTALHISTDDAGPYAECAICGKHWPGLELVSLSEQISASNQAEESGT
ncbi:hypothetical protein [Arthrobacter sp. SX1312]|uniref:DUF7341 domain-containing protein n=1 Tax=Arthrobacter sp. SX1312 TaxID=2058896 RepID=UPI000CE46F9F|nr:hypothetical protein [Arthrobacter sp. SX1312]